MKYKKRKRKLNVKKVFLSSILVDILMTLVLVIAGLAIFSNFSSTNKKVEDNANHITQLETRLQVVENEVATLGYFITTSVDNDGQVYIEINGLRDSNGNVVDFDEYVDAEEFKTCVDKIDECVVHQLTDYNYVKTLNTSEKVIYSVYNDGIAIDGLLEDVGTVSFLEIPETVNGMTVTAIGANCFSGSSISSVRLPSTLTYIGTSAFRDCKNLSSVDFYFETNISFSKDFYNFRVCFI